MSVVPKASKKVSVRSGKREKGGRCLIDDKCEVKCNPPIVISDEIAIVYPDELPPLEEQAVAPIEVPVAPVEVHVVPDESSCVSTVLEAVLEEVVPVLEDVAVRVLSECKTKVWNAVTKRWLKLDGKKARQLGL